MKRMRVAAVGLLAVLSGLTLAVTSAPARLGSHASVSQCVAAGTQVWVGLGEGGGYAGGYALPLEFTNLGKRACTLEGYPGVSAYHAALRQIGPAARRIAEPYAPVTLAPGGSAHAFLQIVDTGAVCGRSAVSASGLRIYAPGQRSARSVPIPLRVCRHRSVLAVGVVRGGVGVPGSITQ